MQRSVFRRIRDKYEAEFRELEHSEKQTKERFNQMKGQLTEVEGKSYFSSFHAKRKFLLQVKTNDYK